MNFDQKAVAERIKEIQTSKLMNQKEFAEAIHVKQSDLSSYLSGKKAFGMTLINRIVLELSINRIWLLTGEGCMIMPKPEEKKEEKEIIPETFNEFFEALKRKDRQIDKRDEQIDRLITLLENERGIVSNGDKKSKGA